MDFRYSQDVYKGLAAFLIAVSVVGGILNLLVIVVFTRLYRKDYKFLNLMIVSTAIADLLPSLSAYPMTAYRTYKRQLYRHDSNECNFEGFFIQLTALVSVSHLALMAYERYMVITSGISRVLSPQWHIAISGSVWLYALLVSCLPLLGWSSYQPEGLETSCTVNWSSRRVLDISFNALLMLADFIIPLVVIAYSYARLWYFTKHNGFKRQWVDSAVNAHRWRVRRKNNRSMTLMVLVMIMMFLLAWMPYVIVSFWSLVKSTPKEYPLLATVPSVFAKSFTLLNPIVYGIKHYKFRREIRKIFLGLIGTQRRRETYTSSSNSTRSIQTERIGSCQRTNTEMHELVGSRKGGATSNSVRIPFELGESSARQNQTSLDFIGCRKPGESFHSINLPIRRAECGNLREGGTEKVLCSRRFGESFHALPSHDEAA